MFIWMIREYDDVEPVVLSSKRPSYLARLALTCAPAGEMDEITIKQASDAIVKAVGFKGEYSVSQYPQTVVSR